MISTAKNIAARGAFISVTTELACASTECRLDVTENQLLDSSDRSSVADKAALLLRQIF